MRKNFIKGAGLISMGAIALVAANFLPVFAQIKQTPTRQSVAISRLPNGTYFYGTSPAPYQTGTNYLFFRKTGNTIVGMKYPLPGEFTCLRGTTRNNTISNTVIHLVPLGGETSGEFVARDPINLNSYYRLRTNQAPEFAQRGLQGCLQVFSNRR